MFTLPANVASHLNNGHVLAAEVPVAASGARCFVRIRPVASPNVPREEPRYLNSEYDMWEYWHYDFRRIVLREGWKRDEWNYDHYLVEDQRETANGRAQFTVLIDRWVPDVSTLKLATETDLPE
jgi:hypothetical protein